jgi:hypothetical protein
MLPFEYRLNKITSIRFRNVSTFNRRYFIEVEPLYATMEDHSFRSSASSLCIVSPLISSIEPEL